MAKPALYIGTSGWHYKHWTGTFYPEAVRGSAQFQEYLKSFRTVEINNSFYRLPTAAVFQSWYKSSPKKFLFAVKASRYFTHMKKLIVDKESITRFFERVDHLDEKLGPILFQLPPRWKLNAERLRLFLAALPKGYRYVFEFREHSWYTEEVYAVLRKYNAAFCIYELERHLSPLEVTASFVYIRLHGPGQKYQGSYSNTTLKEWAERCERWQQSKHDVYLYFDNDQEGYAGFNAKKLIDLSGR